MVFMGADGVEGNVSLFKEAQRDIAEMRRAGSRGTLNIFVERHGGGPARRFHIGRSVEPVPALDADAHDGTALISFVRWAMKKARHRESDFSMLVLWGHAYRFGIGHTETQAGIDALDFAELAGVLTRFQNEVLATRPRTRRRSNAPPKIDVVGFDACDLATVEMACQLAPFAEFLVGSQIGIPLPGWPYDRILERLRSPKGRLMRPAELGSFIVRRYCESHRAKTPINLSCLDLKDTLDLFALTEALALRLATAAAQRDRRRFLRELFRRSQTEDGRPYVDVADLCLNLFREFDDKGVVAAAERLGNFLAGPGPKIPPRSETGEGRPFVHEQGRNACETARLHGVSLYAPHLGADFDEVAASRPFYGKFVFAQQSLWNRLVHSFVRPS